MVLFWWRTKFAELLMNEHEQRISGCKQQKNRQRQRSNRVKRVLFFTDGSCFPEEGATRREKRLSKGYSFSNFGYLQLSSSSRYVCPKQMAPKRPSSWNDTEHKTVKKKDEHADSLLGRHCYSCGEEKFSIQRGSNTAIRADWKTVGRNQQLCVSFLQWFQLRIGN